MTNITNAAFQEIALTKGRIIKALKDGCQEAEKQSPKAIFWMITEETETKMVVEIRLI